MHVRMNTIFGDRDKTAAVLDYIEGRDRAVVEAALGTGGLATYADWDSGVVVAASYWDEPAHSSEAVLTEVRRDVELLAGGTVTAEQYEVTARVWHSRPGRGAVVLLHGVQLESARLDDAVPFLNGVLLPELAQCERPCIAEILVDRDSSSAVVLTVWENEHVAGDASPAVEALRARGVEHGVKFVTTTRYTLFGVSQGGVPGVELWLPPLGP
ncbi:hypothetical protein GCM10023321_39250 [Pseudonocardia eucalypti]|uniref:ABM domain-containing protein n=1 Tax=Pseudonocardia eucalypti TaxID=648755 RepID=A0ABP9Q9K4_9PSEU